MSWVQAVFGWAGVVQLLALFTVLVWRRHYRQLPLFSLYAGGLALTSAAVGLAYAWRVHAQEAWLVHQVASAALRFGVALELTYSIFGAFPAAAVAARRVTFVLLVVTAVTAMSVSKADITYTQFNAEMVPRLATGAVWIFTALAALVLWYRLPLGALQRAILLGYAPYLLLFTVAMNMLASVGWHARNAVGYVDTIAFFVLINYWLRVAWRSAPEAAPVAAPAPLGEVVPATAYGGERA